MAISNINTAWKNDLYPLIDQTFDFEYGNFMNIIRQVVGEEDNKAIDYRLEGMGGYGELPDYNGQLQGMNQKRGFVTIVRSSEKAGSIDIQRRYANVDKSGEAKKAGKRAAYSAAMTVYLGALRMFGRAFNASYVGGDAKAWAATDHPVASKQDANGASVVDADSGTYSNLITDALSVSSITKAQTMANRFVTPDGLPFKCDMSGNGLLLVSPELEPKAKEICGPDKKIIPERLPESAENGANPVYGLQYLVIGGGSDGFSAKQWAVCDKTLLSEIAKIVYIERPVVLRTALDDPLIARIVPYADFGVGFGDGRPIIFSNPA
jgi:hypothetical protein